MKSCIYCKRRYKKNSETSFHRFPKDLEERKLWLQNMRMTNWTPKTYHTLCSFHFADECFDKHINRISLKPGSIPTIFEGKSPFPSLSRPSTSTSSPLPLRTKSARLNTISAKQKILCDANITKLSNRTKRDQEKVNDNDCEKTDNDYEVSSSNNARIKFGLLHDHSYVMTPMSSKKIAQQTRRSLKYSRAKSKALSQLVQKLKLKVANTKSVINELILKNKVSEESLQI